MPIARVLLTAVITIALAVLPACTRPQRSEGSNAQLVVGQIWEPRSLNPLFEDGYVLSEIRSLLFSNLTAYNRHGDLVGLVASSVPSRRNGGVSNDGKYITYHLRHDVRWHDGVALTSRDVVFTFRAIMDPRNAVALRYPYDAVASVRALGPYALRVTMKRPFSPIVAYFLGPEGNAAILPAHLLERYGSLNQVPFNSAPVGSGPYRLVSWARGDRMTMEANPDFFLGKPSIDRVIVKFIPSAQTIVTQLSTGEVDASFGIVAERPSTLRRIARHAVILTPMTAFNALIFNLDDPIAGDSVVRRALAMSIDRKSIVRALYGNAVEPPSGLRALFSWAYDAAVADVSYDPPAARTLLNRDGWNEECGGIRCRNGRTLELSFLVSPNFATLGTQVASFAAAIGVRLNVKLVPGPVLDSPSSQLFAGRFQVAQFAFDSSAYPNAAWLLSCDRQPPEGFNLSRFCNVRVDRLLRDATTTFDRSRQLRDNAEVQRLVRGDLPMIFLYQLESADVVPRRLQGYAPALYMDQFQEVYRWHF